MAVDRPYPGSVIGHLVEGVQRSAHIAAHDAVYLGYAARWRLPLAEKERLHFPEFSTLVRPLPPSLETHAEFAVSGVIEKEGKTIAASLPQSICKALGLTAKNAQIIDVLKGSEHTKAGIVVLHVSKFGQTGDIVVKFGPDVEKEPHTTRLAKEGPVGKMGGMILPGVSHVERNVTDVHFLAMPLVPQSYKSMRELLDTEQVPPRTARRWANRITVLNAIGMKDRLDRNFTGERTSMQFSELDSYRSGLALAAKWLGIALEKQGISIPPHEVWNMPLRLDGANRREYPSLSGLEARMLQILHKAETTPFVAVGYNEDIANKNYHANKKGVIAAELDHGYAAESHQGTLVAVALALAAKSLNTGSVKTNRTPLQFRLEERLHAPILTVAGVPTDYALPAKAYHEHAMSCLPRLARRIVGRKDAPELLAQTYEHLGVNYINTMGSVARKLEEASSQAEEVRLTKLLLHGWAQVGDMLFQADGVRQERAMAQRRSVRVALESLGKVAAML